MAFFQEASLHSPLTKTIGNEKIMKMGNKQLKMGANRGAALAVECGLKLLGVTFVVRHPNGAVGYRTLPISINIRKEISY